MWLLYLNIALYEKASLPITFLIFYFLCFYKIQNTTEETNTEILLSISCFHRTFLK